MIRFILAFKNNIGGGSASGSVTQPDVQSTDIIVSNAGTTGVNGTYKLEDPDATGYNRVWKKVGDPQYRISYAEDSYWYIKYTPNGDEMYAEYLYITSQLPVPENPDNTAWEPWGHGSSPAPTVTSAGRRCKSN
jgi:hypothetical protein